MSNLYRDRRSGTPVFRAGRFARFVREIVAGLDALHRVQFETPWAQAESRKVDR